MNDRQTLEKSNVLPVSFLRMQKITKIKEEGTRCNLFVFMHHGL